MAYGMQDICAGVDGKVVNKYSREIMDGKNCMGFRKLC